jgi:hypothetical protein
MRFSTAAAESMDPANPNNLCKKKFEEPIGLQPDATDPQRRWIGDADGLYRVVIDLGNLRSAAIVRKTGQQAEVFTSAQYPQCLSARPNFSLSPDGTSVHYQGMKNLSYDLGMVDSRLGLRLPEGVQMGVTVYRCTSCD